MTVTSKRKAWQAADALMPTDYEKDEARTAGAGYPIYYSTLEGCTAYICDLGDRLEVNLSDGSTVNVWIEEPAPVECIECDGISAKELLNLASTAALNAWAVAKSISDSNGNEISKARTVRAWARLEVINKLLKKAEAAR